MRGSAGGRVAGSLPLALVAVSSLLAVAARGAGPLPGDLAASLFVQRALPPEGMAGALLPHADGLVWLFSAAAVVFALLGRRWVYVLLISVAGTTGLLVGEALKLLVARPRPAEALVLVYEKQEDYGFPSVTALLSVTLLGTLAYAIRRERPPRPVALAAYGVLLLLIVLCGISRVYVGEHWGTDVVAGWLVGTVCLLVLVGVHGYLSSGRPGRF